LWQRESPTIRYDQFFRVPEELRVRPEKKLESEVFQGGSPNKRIEFYIGWYFDDVKDIYKYSANIDFDYIFNLDVYLMYMSKGGMTLSDLNRLGLRSKDLYLQKYLELYHKVYGKENGDNSALPEGAVNG
jgi:hypothetical protein